MDSATKLVGAGGTNEDRRRLIAIKGRPAPARHHHEQDREPSRRSRKAGDFYPQEV